MVISINSYMKYHGSKFAKNKLASSKAFLEELTLDERQIYIFTFSAKFSVFRTRLC